MSPTGWQWGGRVFLLWGSHSARNQGAEVTCHTCSSSLSSARKTTTYKLTIFIIVKRNNMSTGAPTVNGVARFRHVIRWNTNKHLSDEYIEITTLNCTFDDQSNLMINPIRWSILFDDDQSYLVMINPIWWSILFDDQSYLMINPIWWSILFDDILFAFSTFRLNAAIRFPQRAVILRCPPSLYLSFLICGAPKFLSLDTLSYQLKLILPQKNSALHWKPLACIWGQVMPLIINATPNHIFRGVRPERQSSRGQNRGCIFHCSGVKLSGSVPVRSGRHLSVRKPTNFTKSSTSSRFHHRCLSLYKFHLAL